MKIAIEMARTVGATAYTNRHYPDRPTHTFNVDQLERFAELVRADERARMAEQPAQQEPVAWICEGSSSDEKHAIDYWSEDVDALPIGTQLYTSPPAQQEPFTYYRHYDGGLQDWPDEKTIPLYTAPPVQRTFVGLTNKDLQPIADEYRILFGGWVEDFARAIEAKLMEKNT